MFLLQSQLEPVVLRRLEQLRGVHNGPALGMCNCLRNALQANNSAAGVEWSSTDGNDEIPQEIFQVDLSDVSMSLQLDAWGTWLAPDGVAAKAHYYAATHALVQEILGSILGGSSEPSISRTALDAAWGEDAGSSTDAFLPVDRLKSSLAALATTSSSDGTPQTAAACLSILLTRLQGQPQRWQGLVEQYAAGAEPQLPVTEAEAAGGGGAVIGAVAGGRGATDDNDVADDDDIDALLKEDAGDLKDSTPAVNTALEKVIASADAPETAVASADKTAAVSMEAEDEDDTFSLGLSRVPSHTSVDPSGQEETSTTCVPGSPAAISTAAAAAAARRAARAISVKSVEDPELRRTLSETSSANLDDLPSEDLETLIERANSHANSSTRLARQPAASSGGAPGDINLGHLAEMDLRAWAAKKDKPPPPLGVPRGRPVPGSVLAPLLGRADAVKPVMDQHLKAARAPRTPGAAAGGPGGGPGGGNGTLHVGAFGGSPVRQSMERERGGGGVLGNGISRHGSNDSPTALHPRSRSLGANLSRKLSISEPGPVGPQAEWKHLPALGQATRLHPHEMRQQSYGIPRTGEQSRGRGECAGLVTPGGALMEDKLPSLPALAGARGQPPKAMELFRRPSQVQRSDAHHADTAQPPAPNAHLPGLGPPTRLAAARALCVQATKKKSFRGYDNF